MTVRRQVGEVVQPAIGQRRVVARTVSRPRIVLPAEDAVVDSVAVDGVNACGCSLVPDARMNGVQTIGLDMIDACTGTVLNLDDGGAVGQAAGTDIVSNVAV